MVRRSKVRYLIGGLILAGFIAAAQVYVGWDHLLAPWASLPLHLVVGAALLVFASYWVRAVRLYDYFHAPMHGAFTLCFKLMLQHNLLNNLLPMRAGELSFPVLMLRYFNVPMAQSLPVLVWFRVLDLHTLAGFALLLAGGLWLGNFSWFALLLIWAALPYAMFLTSARAVRMLERYPRHRLARGLKTALIGLPHTPGAFWRAWAWTLINWAVKLGAFAWIMLLFADMPVRAALLGVIAGDLTSVLPVHGIAGAGTYEAGVVAGLLPFRVPAAAALQAAVNVHLFLLGSTLLGGALAIVLPGKSSTSAAHG
ncbi:MAG: lysylphosphatidylglycerol synthase domain-containing protein [Pseudomonadota bacterium]